MFELILMVLFITVLNTLYHCKIEWSMLLMQIQLVRQDCIRWYFLSVSFFQYGHRLFLYNGMCICWVLEQWWHLCEIKQHLDQRIWKGQQLKNPLFCLSILQSPFRSVQADDCICLYMLWDITMYMYTFHVLLCNVYNCSSYPLLW